ncbi:hypothetical protein [Mesorhizobium sp. A623]
MSSTIIYDNAPLGSIIRYSDGTPRPPDRFNKKLAAWKNRNSVGRLIRKEPSRERPTYSSPACFTLHEGDFGQGGVILITVRRTYSVDSDLTFAVIDYPKVGTVRVLQSIGDGSELLHLAESREAAELWLANNRYSNALLEEVTVDEIGADFVEGRAVA